MGGGHHEQDFEHADFSASKEAMKDHQIRVAYRDACAGLLIPLNSCRKETWSVPWKCQDERHIYEKCQYREWKKRVALRQKQVADEAKKKAGG